MEKHDSLRCKNDALCLLGGGLIKWPAVAFARNIPTRVVKRCNFVQLCIPIFIIFINSINLNRISSGMELLEEGIFYNKDETIVSVLFMYILFY